MPSPTHTQSPSRPEDLQFSNLTVEETYASPPPHQYSFNNPYQGSGYEMPGQLYYQPSNGAPNHDPSSPFSPAFTGVPQPPPSAFPFGPGPQAPGDILSPMTTGPGAGGYESYPGMQEVFIQQQQQQAQHQQQLLNESSRNQGQVGPPTHINQPQSQGQSHLQGHEHLPPRQMAQQGDFHSAPARQQFQAATASSPQVYFGYPDQRTAGYWIPQGQGQDRKQQTAPRAQGGAAFRADYSTTTNSSMPLPSAGRAFFPGQQVSAAQFGMHQAPYQPRLQQHQNQNFTGGLYGSMNFGIPIYPKRDFKRFDENAVPHKQFERSEKLENFRANRISQRWELKDIFGYIVEFAGDQHGSRFIQQKLETSSIEDRQRLFDEIMPNAYQLMMDVFGNYVAQKMFEFGSQLQKAELAEKMMGHVFELSMQMYGCRVVQRALEHVLVEQRARIVSEIEPHVIECVKSASANHVIQRLIIDGPPPSILNAFTGHIHELSCHPYGCRVLQKVFERLPNESKKPLIAEMHKTTAVLMQDQFGNYVVQSVITTCDEEDRNKVISQIKGNMFHLCRHKFASNVCEKALQYANPEDRDILINELVGLKPDGSNMCATLLRDAYGNFPLQLCLQVADPPLRRQLLDIFTAILPGIRHTPVGKRLEGKIAQYEAEEYAAVTRDAASTPTYAGSYTTVVGSPPSGSSSSGTIHTPHLAATGDLAPGLEKDNSAYSAPGIVGPKGKDGKKKSQAVDDDKVEIILQA